MTYSTVTKNNILLTTNLSSELQLKMPVLSYTNDANVAVQLALLGSIGILKYGIDIIDKVRTVKNYIEYIVRAPFTVHPQMTIEQIQRISKQLDISTFPVVSQQSNFLLGLIHINDNVHIIGGDVERYMIERKDVVTVTNDVGRHEAANIINKHSLAILPVLDSHGDLSGVITPQSLQVWRDDIISLDTKGRLLVAVELNIDLIGGKVPSKYDIERLIECGVDLLVINVFHAHHLLVGDTIVQIREMSNIPIAVGNVRGIECELYLLERGATIIISDDPLLLKNKVVVTTSTNFQYPHLLNKINGTQVEEVLKRWKYDYMRYMISNSVCEF